MPLSCIRDKIKNTSQIKSQQSCGRRICTTLKVIRVTVVSVTGSSKLISSFADGVNFTGTGNNYRLIAAVKCGHTTLNVAMLRPNSSESVSLNLSPAVSSTGYTNALKKAHEASTIDRAEYRQLFQGLITRHNAA